LLTSNIGSELIGSFCDDPELMPDHEALAQALEPDLRKVFPAAFLGRLNIVPYFPLAVGALSRIVGLHLDKVADRMRAQHDIALAVDDKVVDHIVTQCGTHETGARLLMHLIEQQILPKLSTYWLVALSEKKNIRQISIGLEDNNFIYQVCYSNDNKTHPA
jgi:type VI secretion system protein VasG